MKRRNLGLLLPLMAMGALSSGCTKNVDRNEGNNAEAPEVEAIAEPDAVGSAVNESANLPTDEWVGRWNGPEGLFLDIQPSPDGRRGHYAIANQDNLDRQADYAGVAEGKTVRFRRDGKDLTIRPGTGAETGFKDLAARQDCLIVLPGREGYCR